MDVSKEITIKNKLGLHARPAAQFVKLANRFISKIQIIKDRLKVNGKSIMGVLSLAASCGSKVNLFCNGPDADEALIALENLINSKFGEE